MKRLALLGEFFDDLKTVFQMTVDWFCGRYRALPWYCVAAVLFAALYAIFPLNWIPMIGMLDDIAVVYLCLKLLGPEILRYREWRKSGEGTVDAEVVNGD